jgi:LPXTG-site transpeptidase (sortase) family protein
MLETGPSLKGGPVSFYNVAMKSILIRIILVLAGLGIALWAGTRAYSIVQLSIYPPTPEPYALDLLSDQPDGYSGFVQLNPDQVPTADPNATLQATGTANPNETPLPPAFPPERLEIPAIKLDAPIVKAGEKRYTINKAVYVQWIVPDTFAAGWSPESGYPGRPNNIVLFGHHNVNGAVFANLYKLVTGDTILVHSQDNTYTYTVVTTTKVKERGVSLDQMMKNSSWISPTSYEQLTLVTCWPPWQSTYRLIVIALPPNAVQAGAPAQ